MGCVELTDQSRSRLGGALVVLLKSGMAVRRSGSSSVRGEVT